MQTTRDTLHSLWYRTVSLIASWARRLGAVAMVTAVMAVSVTPFSAGASVPATTSFQGILTDAAGTPIVDGSHAVRVRLYDNTGGNLLWEEEHQVTTEGGLFNVVLGSLNPLTLPFERGYWLTTEVDGQGEMNPPVPLTSSPYALTARTVEPAAIGQSEIADGAVVRSLNGLTDDVTIVGNGGISVSEVGDAIVIDGTGGSGGADSDWLINGNDMYAIPTGNIGIGTNTPTADLYIKDDGFATSLILEDATPNVAFHTSSITLKTPNGTGRLEYFTSNNNPTLNISGITTGGAPPMAIRLDASTLDVIADTEVVFNIGSVDRARFSSSGRLEMLRTDGVSETVEITAEPKGAILLRRSTGETGLELDAGSLFGGAVEGYTDSQTLGFLLRAKRTGSGGGGMNWLYDPAGTRTVALNGAFAGSDGTAGGEIVLESSDTSAETVQIVAQENGSSSQGAQIRLASDSGTATIELDADFGSSNAGNIRVMNAAGVATIELDGDESGEGRIVTDVLEIRSGADLSERFSIGSEMIVDGSSRPLRTGITPEPGMVTCINPNRPGQLSIASTPYDTRVAGVISGAGGVKPGMLMGQRGTIADGNHPVALTGRVYVWADAEHDPIEAGDLLTTSSTPGHAMKVTDRSRAGGAILGKAMTPLASGRGLVLALVALQ